MYDEQPMAACHKNRKLIALALVGIATVYIAALWNLWPGILAGGSDFSNFYAAGQIVLRGQGSRLYDLQVQAIAQAPFIATNVRGGPLPFNHAPFETLLFAPIALLPYPVAFATWWLCNMAMVFALTMRLCPPGSWLRTRLHWIILATALFPPVLSTLIQGQDSILLAALVALAYVCLTRDRPLLAGLALSAAMFKFHLALPIVLGFVVMRQWRVVAGFLSGNVATLLISIALVGWRGVLSFPSFLVQFSGLPPERSGAIPELMPSARGVVFVVFQGLLSPELKCAAAITVSFLLLMGTYAICVVSVPRTLRDPRLYALVVLTACASAYHLYVHDLVLLVVAILIVVSTMSADRPEPNSRLLIAASAFQYLSAFAALNRSLLPVLFIAQMVMAGSLAFAVLKTTQITEEQPTTADGITIGSR